MTWKRRIVSVVVALSLMLGMVGVAHADLGQSAQAEAFARLSEFKLANGVAQPNGTVDPALGSELTRAQMVTLIVRAFGKEMDAQLLKGISLFPDVPADHWASGYVTVAKRLAEEKGISIGRPGGVFDADAKVTNAEVLAFLMKFLGIAPASNSSWPDNYIDGAYANALLTTEDRNILKLRAGDNATRGLAFVLSDSAFSSYKGLPGGKSVYATYVDPNPPRITIDNTVPTSIEAETETVAITGTVDTDVASLFVGSEKVSVSASGRFSATVKPAFGTNLFEVKAEDKVGNKSSTKITIVRNSPVAVGPLVREVRADKTTVAAFEKLQLTAIADDGTPITEGVTWTADSDHVIISPSGLFQSPLGGRYTVTAKAGQTSSFITINVYGQAAKFRFDAPALVANGSAKQKVKVLALDRDYVPVLNFGGAGEKVTLTGLGITVYDENGVQTNEVIAKDGVATFLVTVDAVMAGESVEVTAEHFDGSTEISETSLLETVLPVATGLKAEGPEFMAANTGTTTRDGAIKVWVVDQQGDPIHDTYLVDAHLTGPATLLNSSDTYSGPDSPALFDISNYNHVGISGSIVLTFTVDGLGTTQLTIKQLIATSPGKLEVKADRASWKATETLSFTVTSQDRNGVPVPLNQAVDTELTVKLPDAVAEKFTLPVENPIIGAGQTSATFTLQPVGPFTGDLLVTLKGADLTGSTTVAVVPGAVHSRAFDREKSIVPLMLPETTLHGFVSDALNNPIPISGVKMKVYLQEVSSVGNTLGTNNAQATINGKTTTDTSPITVTTNAEGKVKLDVKVPHRSDKVYMVKLMDEDGLDAVYSYVVVVPTVPGEIKVEAWKFFNVSGGIYRQTSSVKAGDMFFVKVTVTDTWGGPVMDIAEDLKLVSPKLFSVDGVNLSESSAFHFEPRSWWETQEPDLAEDLQLADGDYVARVYGGKAGLQQELKVAYDLTVDSVTGSKKIDVAADDFVGLLFNGGQPVQQKAMTVKGPYRIQLVDQFDNPATVSMAQEITWTVTDSLGNSAYDKVGFRRSAAGGNESQISTRSYANLYLDVNTPGVYTVTFFTGSYSERVEIEVTR